jgi:hypothetical protein
VQGLPVGRGGVKGHNINEITLPGSPFDILRAVSSAEGSRRACPVLIGWAVGFKLAPLCR